MIDFKLSSKSFVDMTVEELKAEKSVVREYLIYLQTPLKEAQAHLAELYKINEDLIKKKLDIEKILVPTQVIPLQKSGKTKKVTVKTIDAFQGMEQAEIDELVRKWRRSKNG